MCYEFVLLLFLIGDNPTSIRLHLSGRNRTVEGAIVNFDVILILGSVHYTYFRTGDVALQQSLLFI